jgi:DNA repair exonuclease SbcCD ATPase subunit
VTDAWRSIKIRQFEHVIAGPSTALLRVSGKPPRRRDGLQRPTLLADDGSDVHRFAAIPSPPDPRGVLRAAYSVPTDVMKPDTVFSLELSDGWVIALPSPTPGPGRLRQGATSQQKADSAAAAPGRESEAKPRARSAHERRAATIDQLAELSAALAQAEQAGGEQEAGRTAAEAELEQSRQQLGALERRIAELEAEAGEAAERLSAAQVQATEAGERAELATAQASERADAAAQEAIVAHDLSESLELRNAELDKSIRELQERIRSLERDVATAVEARAELEGEIAALRQARARSQQELEQALDAVRMMTFERDELSRQAAAFDAVAVKARDRATEAEAANEGSAAALEELQTWRAELERRLTATTTELETAQTKCREYEHELKRLQGELAESEAKFELARAQIETLNAKLAARATPDGVPDAPAPPVTDQSAELQRMAAELAALRAAPATATGQTDGEALDRIQMLESEREEIARRAEQLTALLAPVERLGELVEALSQARAEAEGLQAAVAVELPPSGSVTGREPADAHGPLAGARAEIHALRGQLQEARASAAEAQAELVGHAAEAEARQQAQRELADASGHGRRSGR